MSLERQTGADNWPHQPDLGASQRAQAKEHTVAAQWASYPVALPLEQVELLDSEGRPFQTLDNGERRYQPTVIAEHGLALWNGYLASSDPLQRDACLAQARWICAQLVSLVSLATGGPDGPKSRGQDAESSADGWLSGRALGASISLVTRAYQLTGDSDFLGAAYAAAQLCGRDILDGGVASIPGMTGLFFEEEAFYPAAHTLLAHLEALVGLYDYLDLAEHLTLSAPGIAALRSLTVQGMDTLHTLFPHFDTGRWTCANLLYGESATEAEHALHVAYLAVMSSRCGCALCAQTFERWRHYTRSPRSSPRNAQRTYFRRRAVAQSGSFGAHSRLRVCVPITAFPVQGGMRSVVQSIQQAMADEWEMEYLAGRAGPHGPETVIQSFGLRRSIFGPSAMASSQFPNVWRYVWRGFRALRAQLMTRRFAFLLPQDGVFTGAFAAIAGRMAGIRVVVVDHGNVTLPQSVVYRQERIHALRGMPFYRRPFERLRLLLYWPSARLLLLMATRYADHFLAAGEDVARTWMSELGVPSWRVTLFPFTVKTRLFAPADEATRAQRRAEVGIPASAFLITMVNRLAPEKGIDIALDGLRAFIDAIDPEIQARTRCVIVGAGPLRPQIEAQIQELDLDTYCTLFGEADEVTIARLLGISDVFLYTGVRAINSMAVLEAMAAGCAVVASTAPEVIARYLDDGRGIAIPCHSAEAVRDGLHQLVNDDALQRSMGALARRYVEEHHTQEGLRRTLRRATTWRPLQARESECSDGMTRDGAVRNADRSDLEGTVRPDVASK